jgi:glycosyltransferase involved in cell wall biosynthesis
MAIWLDCSSLRQWKLNHLTGIQRAVLGIHKGWCANGHEPRLFCYLPEKDCFVALQSEDLPPIIRLNLQNQDWMGPGEEEIPSPLAAAGASTERKPPVPAPGGSKGRAMMSNVLGQSPETEEWRQAFAAHNLSRWRLGRATGQWLRARIGMNKSTMLPQGMQAEAELANPEGDLSAILGEGDYLFSIGSECYEQPDHLPAYERLQRQGAKLIRMIYDMIPTSQPQWVHQATSEIFEKAAIQLIQSSDHLLTISEYSRQEILQFASKQGLTPPPVQVIRLGDVLSQPAAAGSNQLDPEPLASRPFFLCLGTLEPRKNHRLLQETWRRLAQLHGTAIPDLVCVGYLDPRTEQMRHEMGRDPLIKNHITILNKVDDEQVQWYFNNCIATIFPSLHEGWGLPVAESLARGKLCLAANATSIPEISSLTVLFDPEDPVKLADLVMETNHNKTWRNQQEQAIKLEYPITEWSVTAEQTLAMLPPAEDIGKADRLKTICE